MTFSSSTISKSVVKYLAADPWWTSSHLDLCPADDWRCILCEIKPQFDSPLVWPAPATQGSSGPQTITPSLSLFAFLPFRIFWLVAKMIVAIPRPSLLLCAVSQGCCCAAWCLWALKDIQNNHKSGRIKQASAPNDSCSHHDHFHYRLEDHFKFYVFGWISLGQQIFPFYLLFYMNVFYGSKERQSNICLWNWIAMK